MERSIMSKMNMRVPDWRVLLFHRWPLFEHRNRIGMVDSARIPRFVLPGGAKIPTIGMDTGHEHFVSEALEKSSLQAFHARELWIDSKVRIWPPLPQELEGPTLDYLNPTSCTGRFPIFIHPAA